MDYKEAKKIISKNLGTCYVDEPEAKKIFKIEKNVLAEGAIGSIRIKDDSVGIANIFSDHIEIRNLTEAEKDFIKKERKNLERCYGHDCEDECGCDCEDCKYDTPEVSTVNFDNQDSNVWSDFFSNLYSTFFILKLKKYQDEFRAKQEEYNEENPPTEWEKKIFEKDGEHGDEIELPVSLFEGITGHYSDFADSGYCAYYTWQNGVFLVNSCIDADFRDFPEETQKKICEYILNK